jgi:hypothetical protein
MCKWHVLTWRMHSTLTSVEAVARQAGRQAGRIQPAHNGQTNKRLVFFCRHQNAIHN